jgi:predicted outer membrane repeat protein
VNGNGGAITFRVASSNSLFACDFINNTAAQLGGAVNFKQTAQNITLNSNFINNNARYGGGISFVENLENVVFNGEFNGNSAEYGGAIAINNGTIANVNFTNNSAKYGGALYIYGNGTVIGSNFVNNDAEDGGAILTDGNLIISNSKFSDNVATIGTNHVSIKENSTITISNVVPEDLGPVYVAQLINLTVSNNVYGQIVKISSKVVDGNNVTLNNGTLSVILNGKTYSGNVSNGTATVEIPNLNAGNYNVYVEYEGNQHVVNSSLAFAVLKQSATITANNKAYVINYGGKYNIALKDAKGNAIAGKKVTFTLNGKNIGSATTNAKGIATIQLTAKILKTAKAGKKNIVIKCSDSNYNIASKTAKITINKEKTKITANKKTFKKSIKVKKYTIALKNSKSKAIKNVKVSLKVKGKTYAAKTNSKGKATFKITKLTKKGTHKAVISYKGNSYYNKATKNVNIKIK